MREQRSFMRSTIRKKRRDWFRIIRDLIGAGVSMSKVAKACGRDTKTVVHWANDGEPKDSDAQVVLALYAKFCPDKSIAHQSEFDSQNPLIHTDQDLDYGKEAS